MSSLPSSSAKQDAFRTRTSRVSFRLHAIPGTACPGLYGSFKATYATSQSCRKRAIVLPDPCGQRRTTRHYPTLFSSELLDDTEEPFSDHPEFSSMNHVQTDQGTCFHLFDWDTPKPDQLHEDIFALSSKGKRRAHHTARTSLGHSIARRLCADAHCPKHPEKATGPLPTTVASDLTLPYRWSLLPCFHKASSQCQY